MTESKTEMSVVKCIRRRPFESIRPVVPGWYGHAKDKVRRPNKFDYTEAIDREAHTPKKKERKRRKEREKKGEESRRKGKEKTALSRAIARLQHREPPRARREPLPAPLSSMLAKHHHQ